MKLLAIDPSSTCCGYAVATGAAPSCLIDAGRVTPKAGKPAHERAWQMAKELVALVRLHDPDHILIETPAITVRGPKQSRSGQARYGMAVGIIYSFIKLHSTRPQLVHVTDADEWTRRVPKQRRQASIASEYKKYDIQKDKGGDVSDAIGMTQWWFVKQLSNSRTAAGA